jgi:hypothetical protein
LGFKGFTFSITVGRGARGVEGVEAALRACPRQLGHRTVEEEDVLLRGLEQRVKRFKGLGFRVQGSGIRV